MKTVYFSTQGIKVIFWSYDVIMMTSSKIPGTLIYFSDPRLIHYHTAKFGDDWINISGDNRAG